MKAVDYFYMGVLKRELKQKIENLIIECKLEITNLGIENMEVEDLKLLNAFIKSKAEEVKATQIYTAKLAFGLTFLTLMLKAIFPVSTIWWILIVAIIFICVSIAFKIDEKIFRKKVQTVYYLSNLLDLHIKEREKGSSN
ncbi:hypothetical protein ACQVPI_13675 [Bacillus wiedmannii]|uniref:hypothetical protein n=1 Tax=Bacillus wiedmannii TaxID=1890302 RepID=UPI003D646E5A